MKKIIIAFILVSLVFILTACPGRGIGYYIGSHEEEFGSFDELMMFVNDFYADSNTEEWLVYFNMDNEERAVERYYGISMIAKKYDTVFYKEIVPIYSYGLRNSFCFVISDNNDEHYQMFLNKQSDCLKEINKEDITVNFLRSEQFNPNVGNPSEYYFDKHDYDKASGSFVRKYEYINSFEVSRGDRVLYELYISSNSVLSDEKITELCEILMDSIVIINMKVALMI